MGNIDVILGGGSSAARLTLAELLREEPDIAIAASVQRPLKTLSKTLDLQPHVLLLDLQMPESGAMLVVQSLQRLPIRTVVLGVTDDASYETLRPMLLAGVRGMILRHGANHHLGEAIRAVAAGHRWLDQRCASELLAEWEALVRASDQHELSHCRLTQRALAILTDVTEGLSNKAIARKRGIQVSTVKRHVSQILGKLGVESRGQAADFARTHGLSVATSSEVPGTRPAGATYTHRRSREMAQESGMIGGASAK